MKKMAKVMVLVVALCLVVPSMCFAAVTVAAATVVEVGQNVAGAYILLADTATTKAWTGNRWFQLSTAAGVTNPMLACALTAMSLGKTINCSLASTTQYATVNSVYVNP